MTSPKVGENIKCRYNFEFVLITVEQVVKIFTAAKHQRVSDHFNKQQRRNIDIWLKMSEDVESFKEEFNAIFEDEGYDRIGKKMIPEEKYEELKIQLKNLTYELEGYKNEAFLAKDEAERKFEKFKAHYIAQQALQNTSKFYPPLPPSTPVFADSQYHTSEPSSTMPDEGKNPGLNTTEAKLISILTAFLMVHPFGATFEYLVSYVKSMLPTTSPKTINDILFKYSDVFCRKTTGVGASVEHKWTFITFDIIKKEALSQ